MPRRTKLESTLQSSLFEMCAPEKTADLVGKLEVAPKPAMAANTFRILLELDSNTWSKSP
jgi:hypothetical protein